MIWLIFSDGIRFLRHISARARYSATNCAGMLLQNCEERMRLVRHAPTEDSKDEAAHLKVAPTTAFRQEHEPARLYGGEPFRTVSSGRTARGRMTRAMARAPRQA